MNDTQIVVLCGVMLLIAVAFLHNRQYFYVPATIVLGIVRFLIYVFTCLFTGWVAFLIVNLLVNLPNIRSIIDVTQLLTKTSHEWPSLPYVVGAIFAFLAWGGVFSVYEKTSSIFQRGRRLISHSEAQQRARGRPAPKKVKAGLIQKVKFQLFLFGKFIEKIDTIFGKAKPDSKQKEAAEVAKRKTPAEDLTLSWGMVDLPYQASSGHFLVTGVTGSGKTLTIRFLMQSVLPNISLGFGMRALIFDPKRDMLPMLTGMLLEGEPKIYILNPFDIRSSMWDMAEDIESLSAADAVAQILIPPEPRSANRFFGDAANQLVSGVLRTFVTRCPKKWTLRDVVLTCRTAKRLKSVLGLQPENAHLIDQYLKEDRTASNIISTIATKIAPFEIVAAMWERSTDKISLTKWLTEESILLLGHHPAKKASLDPMNQAIFQRLSELLLSLPEGPPGKTWLFLDELRETGKLDGLSSLVNQGRSKGVTAVLGTQSIEGLYEVYGQNVTDEITGQCLNKTFLLTNSRRTAQWAENHFGTYEEIESNYSESISTSK
jgi:type IV secretory pathway TraG/TraD family ATPase VirD4